MGEPKPTGTNYTPMDVFYKRQQWFIERRDSMAKPYETVPIKVRFDSSFDLFTPATLKAIGRFANDFLIHMSKLQKEGTHLYCCFRPGSENGCGPE